MKYVGLFMNIFKKSLHEFTCGSDLPRGKSSKVYMLLTQLQGLVHKYGHDFACVMGPKSGSRFIYPVSVMHLYQSFYTIKVLTVHLSSC